MIKNTKPREIDINDQVLVLLPTTNSKLTAKHEGPYQVVEKINDTNYVVLRNGRKTRFHINMLKKFNERNDIPWINTQGGRIKYCDN